MSCEKLFKQMGFECQPRDGGTYFVSTPLCFADGEPISMYFSERGNSVLVSDNANTIFHLNSVGMDVSDRKKWRSIRQTVSSFGLTLNDSGEVTGDALLKGAHHLVSRYLGAMLAIADYEREHSGISDELAQFLDEVEFHLKAWKPNEQLTRNPQITGHSSRSHFFHFQFGKELIDAAKPHSIRTGSILRKAADLQNASIPLQVMVVMDDREDPERAAIETDILSTLVKVLPFTRLSKNLSGGH